MAKHVKENLYIPKKSWYNTTVKTERMIAYEKIEAERYSLERPLF